MYRHERKSSETNEIRVDRARTYGRNPATSTSCTRDYAAYVEKSVTKRPRERDFFRFRKTWRDRISFTYVETVQTEYESERTRSVLLRRYCHARTRGRLTAAKPSTNSATVRRRSRSDLKTIRRVLCRRIAYTLFFFFFIHIR